MLWRSSFFAIAYSNIIWYNSHKEMRKAGETMHSKEEYIAVFDSGVGGISVLRELVEQMPEERYLYFGDSANAPYGDRPTAQVRQLTLAAADMLMARGIKALVVACNTATAAAIKDLRHQYPDTIVVGIEPALKLAYDRFHNGRVGVMATQVTLREEKFAQQLERFPDMQVSLIPAPGLVERIEAGQADAPETRAFLRQLLMPYVGKLDALVLGCTHYPFVKDTVASILGPSTELLDGSAGTARHTKHRLEEADLLRSGEGSVQIENSSNDPKLSALAAKLLE